MMGDDELACILQLAWLISLSLCLISSFGALEIGVDGDVVIWLSRVGYEMMGDELACILHLSLSDLEFWCLEIGVDGNLVIGLSRVGYGGTYRPTRETERQSHDRPDE